MNGRNMVYAGRKGRYQLQTTNLLSKELESLLTTWFSCKPPFHSQSNALTKHEFTVSGNLTPTGAHGESAGARCAGSGVHRS